jgi:site-specific DNA-methyltransferase (cytosine-N4-specific)
MADALSAIHKLVKPGSPFALIIGGNHTVLGGSRFEIETPAHLANIASSRGWQHVETIPLQTYKRYGLHMSNSTNTEALVILRASHP